MIAAAVRLTPRQLQVLAAVLSHGSVDEAACALCLSSATVASHLRRARALTRQATLYQLVAWADDHCPGWRGVTAA